MLYEIANAITSFLIVGSIPVLAAVLLRWHWRRHPSGWFFFGVNCGYFLFGVMWVLFLAISMRKTNDPDMTGSMMIFASWAGPIRGMLLVLLMKECESRRQALL